MPTTTPAAPELKFTPLDLKAVATDGAFDGYASLFDKEDLGRDVVLPGAFRDSLAARGPTGIKMLFQHNPSEPIGIWDTLKEDTRGLHVARPPDARGRPRPRGARPRCAPARSTASPSASAPSRAGATPAPACAASTNRPVGDLHRHLPPAARGPRRPREVAPLRAPATHGTRIRALAHAERWAHALAGPGGHPPWPQGPHHAGRCSRPPPAPPPHPHDRRGDAAPA